MSDYDLSPGFIRKLAGSVADGTSALQPKRKPLPPSGDAYVLASPAPRKPDAAAAVDLASAADGYAPEPGRKPVPPALARNSTMDDFTQSARSAARIANVSFADVMAKAALESNFNVEARSGTSSAAGPFQFIEQTWLDMVKRHGPAYGLGKEAAQIKMRNGVASVADPALRKQLLDLRKDVGLSSAMAARYLSEASSDLARVLKRKPSDTESRMAYFLGPGGAAKLIRATQSNPEGVSAEVLPQAAAANRNFFYGAGGALSNRDAMAKITRFVNRHSREFASLAKQDTPLTSDRLGSGDPNVG
ncbi:MAG: lytic transglycosylase domain-containing protein [Rhodospirillaceae bacterium]